MKSVFLLFLVYFFLPVWLNAQTATDEDIGYIRQQFQQINVAVGSITPQTIEIREDSTEISFYYKDGQLIKVTALRISDTARVLEDYYLDSARLFFVYSQEYPNDDDIPMIENRYYFKDEQLIRWLGPDKKEVPPTHPVYNQAYIRYWEKLYRWMEMVDMR